MARKLKGITFSRGAVARGGSSAAYRITPRAMVGAVPLTSVVILEILVLAALLLWERDIHNLWWAIPLAVLLLTAVMFRSGEPWLIAQGRRLALRARSGRARRAGTDAWTSTGLLPTLFPDLQIRRGHGRTGQVFGVATCGSLAISAVEIRHTSSGLLHMGGSAQIPLERIVRRVTTTQIPLHSIALVTVAVGGPTARPSAALEDVLRDLGDHAVGAGRSNTVVAIRLDPVRARSAIEARGGGHRGLVSALATITNLVEAELRAAGLGANALEPEQMVDHLRDSLFESLENGRWQESWDHVSSGSLIHRSLVMNRWGPAAQSLEGLLTLPGPGTVAMIEVFPDLSVGPQDLMVRAWVRYADTDGTSLDRTAAWATRSNRAGVRFTPVNGEQLAGLRATTILGGDHAPAS